jgi:uncharacterized coiled-coil protein SlyX
MYSPFFQLFGFNPTKHTIPLHRPLLVSLVLGCFALLPRVQALLPPPAPDGGYPNNNTAEGTGALFSLTSGLSNTANGFDALFSNGSGTQNTASGFQALFSNTTGVDNTANGAGALSHNTAGYFNTANGFQALFSNTTIAGVSGHDNTADGFQALFSNTTGSENTANGFQALFYNKTGNFNTANGSRALQNNTTGTGNTANGRTALEGNTTGSINTATGLEALLSNTTGNDNTANGVDALYLNTTGYFNTANGFAALRSNIAGHDNTGEGFQALLNNTGSNNIGLGSNAGSNLTTGSNDIDIGAPGSAGEASTIRIGTVGTHTKAFIAGISVSAITGAAVVVNSNGRLGTAASSARFKEAIKPMDKASEAILALKPVTFRYKHELDPEGVPQFGLIAEEVQQVNPDLVVSDEDGKVTSVRYEAVNSMLLNEFLKEHRKVEQQQSTIDELKATVAKQQNAFASKIAQQEKQIGALTSGLQKVAAQDESSKPSRRVVSDN